MSHRADWTDFVEHRQPSAVRTAPARTLALGRLRSGVLNRTEAAYARHLEALMHAGDVLWFKFEAMTFKLAEGVRYTPDFIALFSGGQLVAFEVKGTTTKKLKSGIVKAPYFHDGDAKPKIKIAADMFPLAFKVVYQVAGQWVEEEF